MCSKGLICNAGMCIVKAWSAMQGQSSEMVSFGALPLPGAHITTLTSLANFRPAQNGRSQAQSLSSSEYEDEQRSVLDLSDDEENDATNDARQAENMHSANQAYDMAMATLADENPDPICKPQWPSATHASHASFEDWAASTHESASHAPARSHDAFSFNPDVQHQHSVHNGPTSPSSQSGIQSIWQSTAGMNDFYPLPVDIKAAQHVLEEFLSRSGLDLHFELRPKPSRTILDLQDKRNVTVQRVLPCGRFMKMQLS